MAAHSDSTPLMKQYWELKEQAGDAFLFFRMGDFYELFGDDAVEASRILGITLTSRDKNKENPVPMAGVPWHSSAAYLKKMIASGRKVAIAEQMEEPSQLGAKQIVRREIVRIFTPAVHFDLDEAEPSFLATVTPSQVAEGSWVLSLFCPATGETRVGDPSAEEGLAEDLRSYPVSHGLTIGSSFPEVFAQTLREKGALLESLPANILSVDQARSLLEEQYGITALATLIPNASALQGIGVLIHYTLRSQRTERLLHLRLPLPLRRSQALSYGKGALEHLDLLPRGDGTPDLFSLINHTRSSLGARELKRWIREPLLSPQEIAEKQEAILELGSQADLARLSGAFSEIYDLERLCGRISAGLANPRDALALARSLEQLEKILDLLRELRSPWMASHRKEIDSVSEELLGLARKTLRVLTPEPPVSIKDGGVFQKGYHPELDRLLTLSEEGQKLLVELEARERQATGIASLKVRYNRVFGYYIEITSAHLKSVPVHYQRKQTMVGAERFFTEELKKLEEELLTAGEKQKRLEAELFELLIQDHQKALPWILQAAAALGNLEAVLSLAYLSREPGWVFPTIDDSLRLEITGGRHPLVDAHARGKFVPNDVLLGAESQRVLLITGPNMGGKSTLMRQVAVIVVLGQMGAPVPAEKASWGRVSSIHTRIGAQDAIARGQSTFMVEMSELAHILHHADESSLVILDEIGRGTSTYDGMSVAWATLDWICRQTRSRTLFATHYHELTRLEDQLPGLANAHMAVEGAKTPHGGELRFLYLLKPGAASESFGIHVAKLAGLPRPLIEKAWQVLQELENSQASESARKLENLGQLTLFAPAPQEDPRAELLQNKIQELDIDAMTPLQALVELQALKELGSKALSP